MTGTDLISWEERLARDAKAVQDAYKSPIGTLSLTQGVLRYEGAMVPDNRINVVVLAGVFVNLWYKDRYDPEVKTNPQCYAISDLSVGMKPHPDALEPQATECDTCGMLQYGTDPVRGRGKWCKEKMRLIMLPAGNTTSAEAVAKSELAQVVLPVLSVKNWKTYAQSIGGGFWAVVSELRLVPDPKAQYKVVWDMKGKLTDPTILSAIAARLDAAKAHISQPYAEREEPAAPEPTGKKKKF